MRKIPRIMALAVGVACVGAGVLAVAEPASAASNPTTAPASPAYSAVCAQVNGPRCLAVVNRVATMQSELSTARGAAPRGLSPNDIQSAYGLKGGKSGTVALIEAGDYPNVEKDLQTYRSQFGLPKCDKANGCLTVVNKDGKTSPLPTVDPFWSLETALDVDSVSAACPACHILVVEAPSEFTVRDLEFDQNMATANATAARLGAKAASNSWGDKPNLEKYANDSTVKAGYNRPGMVTTVASGDSGNAGGVTVPSSFTSVVAVGGTTLKKDSTSPRGWNESAWNGAGSGCSSVIAAPSWQAKITACKGKRAVADVSAVADPATGLAVYGPNNNNQSVWQVVGGTSLASPLIAAIYARAGNTGSAVHDASGLYQHANQLNDITSGNNGGCGAPVCATGKGWDGPTGLGSPKGLGAF